MANTKITTNVIADGAITSAKLDSSSLSIPSTATATTQSAGDNSTKVATTAYVETAVSNLVSAAPAALDTLDELAAALGDDANFSTTITNSLALKAPLASPDFTGDVTFDTSTLVVDSTNNRVGIGTSSPSQDLELNKNAANVNLNIRSSDTGNATLLLGDQSDLSVASITLDNSSNDLIFKNNNQQTAMTIDSSLNVLVGKTSADNGATVGIEMTATDKLYVTDSASSPLIANRLSSDGNVIVIQKDGTSVGTLAARIGDLVIGNNDVGLRFSDGGDSILPAQSGSTGDRDNAIDIGASGARFKSLYLNNFTWDSGQLRIPSSSGGDGDIYLGQYLHIYGRNKSNTAAITLNTTYDGAETDTYTPIYSGNAGAGQLIMKQSAGGEGSLKVYAKTHGTTSTSAALSTFTQIAEFNDAGYFDANNGLYVNGSQVLNSSRQLTVSSTEDTIATFQNSADTDHNFKFELVDASDLAVLRLNGKDGGDNKFIIGYGSTHTSTPNMLALKSNTASGELGFFTDSTQRMHISPTGEVGIGTDNPDQKLHVEFSNTDTSFSGGGGGDWGSDGIRIENTSSTANTMAMLHFRNNDSDIHIAGIRQSGDDSDLGFFFEGSEKLRFTNDGKVGIGTNDPFSILHIGGGGDANVPITIAPATGGSAEFRNTSSTGFFKFTKSNGSNELMRLTADGGLALGFTSTDAKIDAAGYIRSKHATTNGLLLNTGNDQWAIRNVSSSLSFEDDGTQRFVIDPSGRFAMGNTPSISTNYILSIDSNASGQAAGIHFTHGTKNLYLGYNSTTATDNAEMWNAANGYLRFGTNNIERVRLESGGLLTVKSNTVGAGGGQIALQPSNASTADAQDYGFISFRNNSETTLAQIKGISEGTGNNKSHIEFYTSDGTLGHRMRIRDNGTVQVIGALSKGSGTFEIEHPLESKKETHLLRHSFVEAPTCDNIYRGKVTLVNGSASVNLDEASGMTEGTFVLLNKNNQVFTTNESDWDNVKGIITGNTLNISCQNSDSTAEISWLVIGERHDDNIKTSPFTDSDGKLIVEPEKYENET